MSGELGVNCHDHMNEHEKKTISSFFKPGRKERYLTIRGNKKRRNKWLDKLNHTPGLIEKYQTELNSKANIYAELKKRGAPEGCFVISCSEEIDLKEMSLNEAINQSEIFGWGTIISCIPGSLAYYYGEMGEQRVILEKRS